MLRFSISYSDLIKLPYFGDLIKEGAGAEKWPKDRMTLMKTLLNNGFVNSNFMHLMCFFSIHNIIDIILRPCGNLLGGPFSTNDFLCRTC